MSRKKTLNKKLQKTIAAKRINKLFCMAEENALSGNIFLSNRYVELARKLRAELDELIFDMD